MARRSTRSETRKILKDDNNGKISAQRENNGTKDQPTVTNIADAEKIAKLIVDRLAKQHNIHLCKMVPDETSLIPTATKPNSTLEQRKSLRNIRANSKLIPVETSMRITRAVSEGRVVQVSRSIVETPTPVNRRRSLRSTSEATIETSRSDGYICSRCKSSWKPRDGKVSSYIFERRNY